MGNSSKEGMAPTSVWRTLGTAPAQFAGLIMPGADTRSWSDSNESNTRALGFQEVQDVVSAWTFNSDAVSGLWVGKKSV